MVKLFNQRIHPIKSDWQIVHKSSSVKAKVKAQMRLIQRLG
ncbi:hypothetical protein FOTG_14975 [Fusarium oxysporum f. sp. vasinfectum 25433]|uniref:Uncharacterized protein n=1 Tax=Fusarium oxysporum f. sp. vasinfectum 25433 TaxID=1089449 RepID=X0KT33_FUSOX|nr:hypothetical protein FOTG_14975 [Fusarium oxysporum f. sp. vasinfectum 25433]